MKTLYLAFANPKDNPLPTLREEYDKVKNLLEDRHQKGDFILNLEPFATTDKIIATLRKDEIRDSLCVFLFSGHAGRDNLQLEDSAAHAGGIAGLLGRCPNLTLVVLNGCSTAGQVEALFNQNIPVVIATSAPVDDRRATQFSTTFFEELSRKRSSIQEAFLRAIDAARVSDPVEYEIRSRASGTPTQVEKPVWGLYYQEKDAALPDTWRLPEKKREDTTNRYLENAIKGIFDDYETILQAQGEESKGQDVVLKRLPYTISEPIRKLLAPRDDSDNIFYDQPSEQRFKMMLYAYRNIIAFVAYVLLAQLWEEKRKGETVIDTKGILESVKNWLTLDFKTESQRSLLALLREISAIFKDNEIPLFLTELDEALVELSDPDAREAVEFLEKQLSRQSFPDVERLCDQTERSLAMMLYTFGFLINYGLTSVKDINVLFYQHSAAPDFEHKIVKLQQTLTKLEERSEHEKNYFKTASILLRSVDNKERFLYLSPFLIDENAYTKTPKAKLCAFMSYDVKNKHFHFRHVSKPDNIISIEKKKTSAMDKIRGNAEGAADYFPLINGQFSAFSQSVFGKSLEEI